MYSEFIGFNYQSILYKLCILFDNGTNIFCGVHLTFVAIKYS